MYDPIFYWANAQSGISGELKRNTYLIPITSVRRTAQNQFKSNFRRIQMNLSIPLSVKKTDDGKVKAWSLLVSGSYAKLSHKDYAAQLFPDQMLNAQIGLQHIRPLGGNGA